MKITSDETVARIAVECPAAVRVFERRRIDYCCSGDRPLQQACEAGGLDIVTILEEIEQERVATDNRHASRWDESPLDELVDHILEAFHQPLRQDLPRLVSMAHKVANAHRDKEPKMLPEVLSTVLGLQAELEDHMAKEEQVLFPMIKQGCGWMADGPISVMHQEHDSAAAALARLRELTAQNRPHPKACPTWKALWAGLAALEESLHQHIHLENNILFPRALGSRSTSQAAGVPGPPVGVS